MSRFYNLILVITGILVVGIIVISVALDKTRTMFGSFQKSVLISAIVILFITIAFIAYGLYESKKKAVWPPVTSNCPDYWESEGSGENSTCINVKDLGVCQAQGNDEHLIMNFNKAPFSGEQGNCAKYKWANNCKVSWDGLTYGANNPCVK
jgi:hypothetical protein